MRLFGMFIVALALATVAASADPLDDLVAKVAEARRTYDLAAAGAALDEFESFSMETSSEEVRVALVRAALLVAELNRMDYEQGDLRPLEKRRLGKVIDAAARKGHETLALMEETSEKYRMMADLWGTMIRSNYQGKKYAKKMDQAQEKAIELDPNNPNAHVTACKRKLFAKENRGGDLAKALEHLNRALELNPECEPALILRGIAHEKNDDLELAKKDWLRVIELNPTCRPAKDNLERVMGAAATAE